nr:hypothetical protein [Tanacetum cinerariifolium]
MIGVKQYLHKYSKESGLKVVFGDNSSGDAINFNEVNSFPDDDFNKPRTSDTLCNANTEYFPYVPAFDRLFTINHVSPEPLTTSPSLISSTSEDSSILNIGGVLALDKTQTYVAMSLAKDEYVAAAGCCAQVLWINSQLADYDVLYDKVPIFYDNTSAINNLVLHSKTKHIDIRYHFIRDHNLKGDIKLRYVPIDLQLADISTKPLAEPSFTRLKVELDVSFQPKDYVIKFNNGVALLETNVQGYVSMFDFLKKSRISVALTKQPSTYYPKLKSNEPYVLLPQKETVKDRLATLGLFDEDNLTLLSFKLIKASLMKVKTSLVFDPFLRGAKKADMSKKTPVTTTHSQETEKLVDIANTTKGIEVSKSAETRDNQLLTAIVEKNLVTCQMMINALCLDLNMQALLMCQFMKSYSEHHTKDQHVETSYASAVIFNVTAEGEKEEKNENANPDLTQGENQAEYDTTPFEQADQTQREQ